MGSTYSGEFEDWEVGIAIRLSCKVLATYGWIEKMYPLGDLVQVCLIHWDLARHTYDPSKGASLKTYMTRVVRRRLLNILEKHGVDPNSVSLDQMLSDQHATPEESSALAARDEDPSLRIDLDRMIAKLPAPDNTICLLHLQGYNITEIGRRLGMGRATIYDHLHQMAKIFSDANLQEYL